MDSVESSRLRPPATYGDAASTTSFCSDTSSVSDLSLESYPSLATTLCSDSLPTERFKISKLLEDIEQVHEAIQAKFDTFSASIQAIDFKAIAQNSTLKQLETSYTSLETRGARLLDITSHLNHQKNDETKITLAASPKAWTPIYSNEFVKLLGTKSHHSLEIRLSYTTTCALVLIAFYVALLFKPKSP